MALHRDSSREIITGTVSPNYLLPSIPAKALDGRLKVLAVTDKARAAAMPDVPTTAEDAGRSAIG